MYIGKIVNSSSHIEYICQVYGPGEVECCPLPEDYAFGTFVGIERPDGGHLVGAIWNTSLLNPEFGNLGPRLSPSSDLAVFSPDYLSEKVTLVAVVMLGSLEPGGAARQGVPALAASIDAQVRLLERDEIVAFHQAEGRLQLGYLPMLASLTSNPLAPYLSLRIVELLGDLFPDEASRLAILADNLAWKTRVEPVG